MKIKSVKINNVRSFLDVDNCLYLEDKKTAVIGVNESGKSNLLETVGKVNFLASMPTSFNLIRNISEGAGDVQLIFEMKMESDELAKYNYGKEDNLTTFIFKINSYAEIKGTLSNVIAENEDLQFIQECFNTQGLGIYYNTNSYKDDFNEAKSLILECSNSIINLQKIQILKKYIKATEEASVLLSRVERFVEFLEDIYFNLLPRVFYRKCDEITPIKKEYLSGDTVKELSDVNSSIYKLTKAAKVKIEDMKKAFSLPGGTARLNLRHRIEKEIELNICKEFKEFYQKRDLALSIRFDGDKLSVNAITGDLMMTIGERSNGLRWYLGLFIELMATDYKNKSILYLLDEPGVYLHVNAQKELLSLFNHLCENKGQLVYTTHLPHMLDTNNVYEIRRIEKDNEGVSHIFNRVYSGGVALPTREDTLTPFIQSMGCDLRYMMYVAENKTIVTEGITDRMYLEAGMKILDIDEKINFIPSNGAASVPNIASILVGWGCSFLILLDYDREGFTQYNKIIKNFGEEIKDKIIFVVDEIVPKDVNDRTITYKTIESILSSDMMNELENKYDGTTDTKTICATEFREKIMKNKIEVDEETKENYKTLFSRLGIH